MLKKRKLNFKNLLHPFLLGLLCLFTYTISLTNPFLMDDHALILQNRNIADLGHLQLNIFDKDQNSSNGADYVYFRPITHLADLISYMLFDKDEFGYHAMNLLLYLLCALTLFELIKKIINNRRIAFLTSAFFVSHPINGVLINYTTTTGFICLMIFTFLGMIFHLRYDDGKNLIYLLSSYLLFGLSLLCHETAAMYPFYLAAILYFLRDKTIPKIIGTLVPYLIIIGIYLAFRTHYASLKSGVIDQISEFNISIPQFFAMYSNLVVYYLKNLLFLQDIALMWSSPVITDTVWIYNFILISIIGISLILIFRIWKKDPKSVGLVWILIGLAPVTMACFSRRSMGFIISPHWLLVSSTGFFLLLATILEGFTQHKKKLLTYLCSGIIILTYSQTTRQYNKLWGNEIQYCKYMLSLSPDMPLIRFWLGNAYMREYEFGKAIELFKSTLTGAKSDWTTYTNLGYIESLRGNNAGELENYLKAMHYNPDSPELLNNIGTAYIHQQKYGEAEKFLEKALEHDPRYIEPRKNLTVIYRAQDRYNEMSEILEEVIQIDPQDEYAIKTLQFLRDRKR